MEKQLFNPKTIKRLCSKVKLNRKQKVAAKSWLYLLEQGILKKEKESYFKFAKYILEELLGYDLKSLDFEAGNIEFPFKNKEGKTVLGIEVKGTKTKNLFAEQKGYREGQETPINQLWNYMGKLDLDYGIATNYQKFVLMTSSGKLSAYHRFDFLEVKNNEEKLKEFVAIFSKEQIIDNQFIEKLEEASAIEERHFTKEFYKLFHETRLMLIKEFQENGVSKEESIHYAQLYLNRLMFVFFAEDTDKLDKRLFEDSIINALKVEGLVNDQSKLISDSILSLFRRLDKGSATPRKIFGFNGGLFREVIPAKIYFKDFREKKFFWSIYQNSRLKKEIELDAVSKPIFERYGDKLNPVIKNLLIMASFDFNTEINVNILGHIFEQSLSDLEELKENKKTKRKKEGIFYTPEYITDYICRNTILPYLSKKDAKTPRELVLEYKDSIKELENKFAKIKILDPACGSGAFLIKAIDVLLEIHKEVQIFKQNKGEYIATKKKNMKAWQKRGISKNQVTLIKWSEESEAKEIIENNIFGVDLNEESVEITKLSLFLKITMKNKKLIDLSKNIKVGNSLIDDKSVDPKAFEWKKEFKDIFDKGGFDIVIGNPPYVGERGNKEIFRKIKTSKFGKIFYKRKMDLFYFFFHKALDLGKPNAFIAFITTNYYLTADGAIKLRTDLKDRAIINEMINFNELKIFDSAKGQHNIITILKKGQNPNFITNNYTTKRVGNSTFNILELILSKKDKLTEFSLVKQKDLYEGDGNYIRLKGDLKDKGKGVEEILWKIKKDSVPLIKIKNINQGLLTGVDKVTNNHLKKFKLKGILKGEGIYVLSDSELKKLSLNSEEKKLIKPFYKNSNIFKYFTDSIKNKQNLIYLTRDLNINKYPHLKEHVYKYKAIIKARSKERGEMQAALKLGKWWVIFAARPKVNFNSPKIVCPQRSPSNTFGYNEESWYASADVYYITDKNKENINLKYILTLLNSKLFYTWFYFRGKRKGELLELFYQPLTETPIKKILPKEQKPFIEKADLMLRFSKEIHEKKDKFLKRVKQNFNLEKLSKFLENFYNLDFKQFCEELKKQKITLSIKQQDEWEDYFEEYKQDLVKLKEKIYKTDNEIDEIVYKLYGITEKEKKIVEESFK